MGESGISTAEILRRKLLCVARGQPADGPLKQKAARRGRYVMYIFCRQKNIAKKTKRSMYKHMFSYCK